MLQHSVDNDNDKLMCCNSMLPTEKCPIYVKGSSECNQFFQGYCPGKDTPLCPVDYITGPPPLDTGNNTQLVPTGKNPDEATGKNPDEATGKNPDEATGKNPDEPREKNTDKLTKHIPEKGSSFWLYVTIGMIIIILLGAGIIFYYTMSSKQKNLLPDIPNVEMVTSNIKVK
jgi:hypothetical protein